MLKFEINFGVSVDIIAGSIAVATLSDDLEFVFLDSFSSCSRVYRFFNSFHT